MTGLFQFFSPSCGLIKLRRKVDGDKMKHVPALYLATAMALQGMTKQELEALKLRIEEKAAIP